MKKFLWPIRAFLFAGLLQIISCTKTVDTATNASLSIESSNDATVAPEFPDCKLRYIIHEHGAVQEWQTTGLFTYYNGNPIKLDYGRLGNGSGNPNHYFFYDKKNRLREYRIGFYNTNEGYEESVWHRYGYNSSDQIVVDTTLTLVPPQEGEQLRYEVRFISTLTYDAQGRIIKESIKNVATGSVRNPTYTYDNRGNLGVLGWKSSSYDNKVSIFRSHPVFQFIHRNYSKNNAAPQAKYNSKGLPLSLYPSNDEFFNAYKSDPGGGYVGGISKVIYDCK